jgi:hypothetical protein
MSAVASERPHLLAQDAVGLHGRRWRVRASLVVVLAGLAAAVTLMFGGGGGRSLLSVRFTDRSFTVGGLPMRVGLNARTATADFSYDGGSVVDDGVPTRGARVLATWTSAPADRETRGVIIAAIVGPGTAGVRANGLGAFLAHHVTGLPSGYKAVVFVDPQFPALASVHARTVRQLAVLARGRGRQLEMLLNRLALTAIR